MSEVALAFQLIVLAICALVHALVLGVVTRCGQRAPGSNVFPNDSPAPQGWTVT